MNVLPPQGLVDWLLSPANWLTLLGVLSGGFIALTAVRGFARSRQMLTASASGSQQRGAAIKQIASSWQLILLGTTALLLSIASGYRVWEGMTNFTNEKHLSLMITFGLQGIMLIVAWLIGESFASGMNRRLPDGRRAGRFDAFIGVVLGVVVVAFAFYWVLYASGTFSISAAGSANDFNWSRFADVSAYFALGLIVLGVLALNFSRGGELSLPYVQSIRIIIKNAMLWVMYLACMAAAVFFSFDSLFTSIFPKEERARAAQLRAQNQVAGMVADIGTTIEKRRLSEVGHLFATKDNGWVQYDNQLSNLAKQSQGAQSEIETYFNSKIEEKNRSIKQQQERIASAQSGSAGLAAKKNLLTDEISRLKGERPALASDYAEKKSELDNRAKGVDAKRVEAQAEDRGAEGTLKQGKGPVYRQIMTDLARLQDAYKIQETRVRDSQQRLSTADTRIAQLERELASVDGDLAKLKGEAETAEQRIKLTQEASADDNQPRIDPTRILGSFEKARLEFRQEPTKERLGVLHQQCGQLYSALIGTPATRDRVRGVDCDPKQATEAAAVMFALNEGLKTFNATCVGGDKLENLTTTDALYSFARKCLADSGLPAKETDDLRGKINYLELTRDDKAHPFVASLNAFHDGNRLAFLALAIAIIMESLVFMAGLFGATAVRSPLSDVPSTKARSGKELEKLIETALGEEHERYDHARLVFQRLRPSSDPSYSMQVSLSDLGPTEADAIMPVLSAGREIGAVEPHPQLPDTYLVRGELFAFIAKIANRKVVHDTEESREHELKKIILSALQPFVGDHADIVLHQCRPISERNGFSSEVYLSRMPADEAFVTQKVLNAGATLNYVQLDERPDQDQRYYVHKQLYKTLLLISSAAHRSGQRSRAPQLGGPDTLALEGGSLRSSDPAVKDETSQPLGLPSASASVPERSGAHLSDDELRRSYWNRLVAALEIDPSEASNRLRVPGLSEAAALAWDALVAHGKSNRRLDDLLNRHRRQQEGFLQSEFDLISEEIRGDRHRIDLLENIDDNVRSHLPAMMVFPENGLLASIVSAIENAAQSDNGLAPGEQQLKDRLKSLQQDIAGLDLAKASNWEQIRSWYEDSFALDRPNILRLAQRQPRQ